MSKTVWMVAAVVFAATIGIAATSILGAPKPSARDLAQLEGDVERGAYVARLAGCIACHTDAESGRGVLAGGAAIETRFGTFHAPNITPHEEDGIGLWSVDDFSRSLTAGLGPDGQHYFPAFPYPFYARLTDQDIVDLWSAVRSVPPVTGKAPTHELRFPFNIRPAIGLWKALNFRPSEGSSVPTEAKPLERGRYIVEGPAHCGSCHTPRDLLGGRDLSRKFRGGESASGGYAPSITANALHSAGWTVDDLAYALATGIKPDGDVFGGAMAEVIQDGSQFWSEGDLNAVAAYLLEGTDR